MMPEPCAFCEIVARRSPASIVHQDDTCLSFMDNRPATAGHLLVIPRTHATHLADLDPVTGQQLFAVAQRLAAAVRLAEPAVAGINLFLADGEVAGQEVFHVHLHVLPRYSDDTFRVSADWSVVPTREDLDAFAARIQSAHDAGRPAVKTCP
jgi:histidine triad (HIT) family protein